MVMVMLVIIHFVHLHSRPILFRVRVLDHCSIVIFVVVLEFLFVLLDLFLQLGRRMVAENDENDVKSELGKEPDQATEDGDQRALPGLCFLRDG
ncbi:hypothetical protein BKA57DRAFT_463182 [Linnemannia elongata]|nr:hypothetical protein BKA57DRAFT_463182 [Linnemannia elongata]